MNMATFERAKLADFAHRTARYTGSLDCMRAMCYVIRNRVRAGWGDGTWLSVIESHHNVDGNTIPQPRILDSQDRPLQLLLRDIDDIYNGTSSDLTQNVIQDALYFQAVDLPPRQWFVEHIVRKPTEHERIAQVGPFAFFR
jgi:hypothetical protein